jgi:hypothetical protein
LRPGGSEPVARPRLVEATDLQFDNLWESDEAREAVLDWVKHPGYGYFSRRVRISEVQQLRTGLNPGPGQEFEAGVFKGMVIVRRMAELMASEARIKETNTLEIPDTDPDELHALLLRTLIEYEAGKKQTEVEE